MKRERSLELFKEAQEIIPGGVNSPVRSGKSVGMDPFFVKRGKGAYIYDADGNAYIDYVLSWGPLILGHAHPSVVDAVKSAAEGGLSFGTPTELETRLAEKIVELVPSVEMVRLVNSGTEACMSALRLARAITGRDMVIKFDGCYHGHADSFLVKAGSGVATLGIPGSPGVPEGLARLTLSLPFNNSETFERAMDDLGDTVACVIVEPVAGNMGCMPPGEGFLESLRQRCTSHRALLIFDEVMSGFRVALGGAQELYNITPDITCLGKVIGGGLPVGAYAGPRKYMERIAPSGDVYQAGTLSGNPLAVAAGLATLSELDRESFRILDERCRRLFEGLLALAGEAGIAASINQVGSMGTLFFTDSEVHDFESSSNTDTGLYNGFFREMTQRGAYFAPSKFEASFMSLAHGDEEIAKTLDAAREALRAMA